ncbi:MAG: Usg family protein [Alphaproteobacteria bacterium]|nr:Usg family protein [Alphaproteobacteria bacterium]
MGSLELQLQGYRLTTAEIIYRMPDHPGVLQSFIWQNLDLAPRFPMLHKFLAFWEKNIEGTLHKIIVANTRLITPSELRAGTMMTLQ